MLCYFPARSYSFYTIALHQDIAQSVNHVEYYFLPIQETLPVDSVHGHFADTVCNLQTRSRTSVGLLGNLWLKSLIIQPDIIAHNDSVIVKNRDEDNWELWAFSRDIINSRFYASLVKKAGKLRHIWPYMEIPDRILPSMEVMARPSELAATKTAKCQSILSRMMISHYLWLRERLYQCNKSKLQIRVISASSE